jgi:hypothetical protein
MKKDAQPKPESGATSETVGALLARALEASPYKENGQHCTIFTIPGAAFKDYMLRVDNRVCLDQTIQNLREQAMASSALHPVNIQRYGILHVPDFFFSGPEVSQALLAYAQSPQRQTKFEIIRRQPGQNLEEYIRGKKSSEPLSPAESVAAHRRMHTFMRAMLNNPEPLRALFQQVAFIGYQARTLETADIHAENIMLHESADGSIALSLIDIVGQERICDRREADPFSSSDYAEMYVRELRSALQCFMYQYTNYDASADIHNPELEAQFESLLAALKNTAKDDIYGGMVAQHEKWQGFQRLQNGQQQGLPETLRFAPATPCAQKSGSKHATCNAVSAAVALSDPPEALKLALDRLYEAAVPEQVARG